MAVIRPLRPRRGEAERRGQELVPLVETRLEHLVVITGFSGAGKSTAMNVFEDAGYFCVDNLPPELIRSLVEVFSQGGSKVERAALVIDTAGMSAAALRGKIAEEFLPHAAATKMALTFMSFGFKHGPPREEDLALDVRFLANPHYEADLRELTGLDERVVEHIARDGRLGELYERLFPLFDFLLPQYVSEGKAHLVVAIGCTGGRHRSVAIAEHLAERYRGHEGIEVAIAHRDIDKRPSG